MDVALLQAVVSEAALRLTEQELVRVGYLGRQRYLLRFATPDRDNLLVSVRPDGPRLHLLPGGVGRHESPPDPFAAIADRELAGARLLGLHMPGDDRVVEIRCRLPSPRGAPPERVLMVELFGRSANLLLLDGSGLVMAMARDLDSAFRVATVGAPYQPPRPLPPGASGPARVAASAPGLRPVVYSQRPLGDYREGDRVGRDDLLVAPAPIEPPPRRSGTGEPMVATPFAGPSEAAQAAFDLLERLRDFDDERARHQTEVRREIGRLVKLESRLVEERERAVASDQLRRRAEALLAGLASARVTGGEVSVPDPEATDGSLLAMPIDPTLSLQQNAQRLFDRWKKGKRAIAAIDVRLLATRRRLVEWRALEPRAAAAASEQDLRSLRGEMDVLGLVHVERKTKRSRAPASRQPPTRVRRHTTADGFEILVGKSGPENDTLTFRIASPWDFWLHAAESPGAHVVVRNPRRLGSLPDPTLRVAAGIAAFYSGRREEGRVEVHYTQRKHVRKHRGMPPGQVLVRKFRSIQVTPRLPHASLEDV